mmetsp:Transcript_12166/g.39973  ORF Transcript_12166/g.39973 Transcript_12166/m.39973 type:complete len:255 (-) Transcript_12166:73-837(-)
MGRVTSPMPSSADSLVVMARSVCGTSCCWPASTASKYGLLSCSRSRSTTEHRSAMWMVGSRLAPSSSERSGSGSQCHADLKSGWKMSSSAPYVIPAATTCVRRTSSRLLLVTSFSRASRSLNLICGRRRLYSSSVSGVSGASSSTDVRIHVTTDETPTSTLGSVILSLAGMAASCFSASTDSWRQSSTVISHSRKAASRALGVCSTIRLTQSGLVSESDASVPITSQRSGASSPSSGGAVGFLSAKRFAMCEPR